MWIWHTRLSVTPRIVADLRQREALVVVEGEHEPLAVGHAVDRVGEQVLHLVGLERFHRIVLTVGDRVADGRRAGAIARARGEQLVERDETGERDLRQRVRELGFRHVELGRDLCCLRDCGAARSRASSTRARSRAALARTDRGTQSIERSSSMIAPLMREIAYVSNLKPRPGSNLSIASMSPKIP